MVASGLVLWTVKRREKLPDPARPHLGFRLVAWLNTSVVAGFPLGIAAMFWANRLLPMTLRGRAEWEIHVLFIAWGLALALALVLPAKRAWIALLAATGASLAALPVYNVFATRRGLTATLAQGDAMLAGIDLSLLVFGAAFLAVAWRVSAYTQAAPRTRRKSGARYVPDSVMLEPAE
jgi:hypothetical protein